MGKTDLITDQAKAKEALAFYEKYGEKLPSMEERLAALENRLKPQQATAGLRAANDTPTKISGLPAADSTVNVYAAGICGTSPKTVRIPLGAWEAISLTMAGTNPFNTVVSGYYNKYLKLGFLGITSSFKQTYIGQQSIIVCTLPFAIDDGGGVPIFPGNEAVAIDNKILGGTEVVGTTFQIFTYDTVQLNWGAKFTSWFRMI